MGKPFFPAIFIALGMALAAPEAAAQEPAAGEDQPESQAENQPANTSANTAANTSAKTPANKPLPRVAVHGDHTGPDQERLNGDDLSRHRGTGPADVFSAVNGVMSNSVRNEAGAIDVGIRGLQGEGRVPVIIDGALQSTHTHRGYQGEADRTYIDMDLVRQITVTKGATFGGAATGAIGGLVEMRTLEPDDVVLPGQRFGILMKGSLYNNNRSPDASGDATSQHFHVLRNGLSQDRFNNGAATLALAGKHDGFDWLMAHSQRRDGNYFAGRHGIDRYGEDAVVSAGQEVVNTSYQGESSLLKLGIDLRGRQRLEYVWRHHEQRAGELLASSWFKQTRDRHRKPLPEGVDAMAQWAPGSVRLDSHSLRYAYVPADSQLVDLKMGVWKTGLTLHQFNGLGTWIENARYGDQYRHRYADTRQGINLSNRSLLPGGHVSLEVGASADEQRTRPLEFVLRNEWEQPTARDARRSTYGTWLNATVDTPQAMLKVGARMHGAVITDYVEQRRSSWRARTDLLAQLQVPLVAGVGLYGKAGRTYRQPSLFEASSSMQVFRYDPDHPLSPEQSDSWALGLEGQWSGLLVPASSWSMRGGYFSNNVRNHIASAWLPDTPGKEEEQNNLGFTNYDRLRLSGWELKAGFDVRTLFVEVAGSMLDRAQVCSREQALMTETPDVECNEAGFAWGLVPTRIPPRRSFNLTAGLRLFDERMVLGGRLSYHAKKSNPSEWLEGTGASPVIEIPSERIVDLFASMRLGRHVDIALNVDNLQNRYAFDPGTVIKKPRPGRTVRLTLTGRF